MRRAERRDDLLKVPYQTITFVTFERLDAKVYYFSKSWFKIFSW